MEGRPMTSTIEQLKADEGFRQHPYRCTAGALTIGYGRNIDPDKGGKGISEGEASIMLRHDLIEAEDDLADVFPDWSSIDLVRRGALLNMRFQLGPHRFRGFKNMIAAARRGYWIIAAREASNSLWARQTPERAYRVAMELRDGVALT